MDVGSKIKLVAFNGEKTTPDDCEPEENYWLLIGKTGRIVGPKNKRLRVLVQFDESVSSLGLHCHNENPNSLLILISDLERIECT